MNTTQLKYPAEAVRMAGIGQLLVFGLRYFADPLNNLIFIWSAILTMAMTYTGLLLLKDVNDR